MKQKDFSTAKPNAINSGEDDTSPYPALRFDIRLYERYLDDTDMTEQQSQEFLETLWTIIVGFVDLGFGISPVQQASDACKTEDSLINSPVETASQKASNAQKRTDLV